MGKDITITKRDGSHEVLDLEKMHKVVFMHVMELLE